MLNWSQHTNSHPMSQYSSTSARNHATKPPTRYGFLVVPGFSLIAYAAAIDTLRLANRVANQEIYSWETFSVDGKPVTASNGLEVTPQRDLNNHPLSYAVLFVCGGAKVHQRWSQALGVGLHNASENGMALGSLCTGAYLLAKAGLLDGYRCTVHWEYLPSMREEFPKLKLTNDIYEIDTDRYTCSGGTTPIDMMLELISLEHGPGMAANISEEIVIDRIRNKQDTQRIPLRQQLGTSQPKMTEAVLLMESNLEEPLSPDELANYVNISRRQLERLFRSYLSCTPSQYYLRLRLRNARLLILHTEKTIVEISLACGFVSPPHFSKCYREMFNLSPRDTRRRLQVQKGNTRKEET